MDGSGLTKRHLLISMDNASNSQPGQMKVGKETKVDQH